MSRRPMHVLRALVVIGVVAAIAGAATPAGHAKGISYHSLNKIQKRLISGSLAMSLTGATSTSQASDTETCGNGDNGGEEPDEAPSCPPDSYSPAPGPGGGATGGENYSPSGNNGCAENRGNNVKVNQECLTISDSDLQGRGQSQNEESIAADPNDSKHIVASQNDYRRGDGNCEAGYSLDGGKNWNDSTVPIVVHPRHSRTRAREYWQAGGDTSVAWDTRGNAYYQLPAVQPRRRHLAELGPVERLRRHALDAEQRRLVEFPGPLYEGVLRPERHEWRARGQGADGGRRQLRAARSGTGSTSPGRSSRPTAPRTSTRRYSNDYGEHFSAPGGRELGQSDAVRPRPTACRRRTGAATRTRTPTRSSALTAHCTSSFNNYNNGGRGERELQPGPAGQVDRRRQHVQRSRVMVSNYYDLPECDTYQGAGADPGRACVPEKGSSNDSVFRATNYPIGGREPEEPEPGRCDVRLLHQPALQ